MTTRILTVTRLANPSRFRASPTRHGYSQGQTANNDLLPPKYAQKKGFADDLGEGKISLPLIHALATKLPHQGRLRSILQQRKAMGGAGLSHEVRKLALADIKATGGLERAKMTAMGLQEAINETLTMYEDKVGEKNWLLRLAQKRLEVD